MTKIQKLGGTLARTGSARDALRRSLAKEQQIATAPTAVHYAMRERLVLCLDVSGSMYGPKINALRDAATDLIKASRSSTIAVIAYSTHANTVSEFTDDTSALVNAVRSLEIAARTRGSEALALAFELHQSERHMARRVIFMSDGVDDDPDAARSEARRLTSDGVIIDTIAFGKDADRSFLSSLASNGVMKEANDAASLKREFLALEAGVRGILEAGR